MCAKSASALLTKARRAKEDEFYTQLVDIERELVHYREHFRGKTVLCNCDDPRISNFFHYFSYNFEFFGLKKLITTCYKNQDRDLFSRNEAERAIWLEYNGAKQDENVPNPDEIGIRYFKEDGDFRSEECIELLQQADVVVTNPPFSLFREYVAQLVRFGKRFVIIGNQNAITYREIFPLFKADKIWLGYGFKRNCAHFITHYEDTATDTDHREGMIRVPSVTWFTNLSIPKRNQPMILYRNYSPEMYPRYDNYDAIEVGKTEDIPCDYDGVMGVPITFMYKYNPEQFEIVGATESEGKGFSCGLWKADSKVAQPLVNGKRVYKRIFIRKRK